MYEGLDSYVGHAEGDEDRTGEKLGWWENVSVREDGRPQGDYCLNPKHPLAPAVIWAAKHRPSFYKMSHVADVRKVKKPDGRIVVETMARRAHSVDLVGDGGTTETLLESGRGKHKGTRPCYSPSASTPTSSATSARSSNSSNSASWSKKTRRAACRWHPTPPTPRRTRPRIRRGGQCVHVGRDGRDQGVMAVAGDKEKLKSASAG